MILLLAYLFLALFVSFLCSIMEAVLLSTPISFLIVKDDEGSAWAKGFIDLKTNVDKPLSAILSLNTVADTIGAAGVGAQATAVFGEVYFGLVSAVLTVLILVLSEIIPRVVVDLADEEEYLTDYFMREQEEKKEDGQSLKFSRIPVYSKDEEDITGYVFRQDVYEKLAEDKFELRLKDIRQEIIVVPNTIVIFTLWEKLLEKSEHIALIVDEYGGLDGVVTMEDIIETLLGLEIVDEKDTITAVSYTAKEKWEKEKEKIKMLYQLEKRRQQEKENQANNPNQGNT